MIFEIIFTLALVLGCIAVYIDYLKKKAWRKELEQEIDELNSKNLK